MDRGDVGRELAQLVEQAQAAREVYDRLVLDPHADDDDIERAREASQAADDARNRAAHAMRAARTDTRPRHSPPLALVTDLTPAPTDARHQPPSGTPTEQPEQHTTPGQTRNLTATDNRQARTAVRDAGKSGLRELLADALVLVGTPLRAPDLAAIVSVRTNRKLTPGQLTQTRREERRRYDTATAKPELTRPFYLVPCLSADTLAPATGTYALSTWPLPDRLVSPYSPRIWSCHAAANLARALTRTATLPDTLSLDQIATVERSDDTRALLQALLRFVRGNDWGRDGLHLSLQQLAADADAEARALRPAHTEHTRDAIERLAFLTRTDPTIPLWGWSRPDTAREEGTS